jgi:hypothetical protein
MKACSKLWNFLRKIWDFISNLWIITSYDRPSPGFDDVKLIKLAGDDISAARNLFSRADDPDMIEWAIFSLTAAEKRYDYLLRKYKQKYYSSN